MRDRWSEGERDRRIETGVETGTKAWNREKRKGWTDRRGKGIGEG